MKARQPVRAPASQHGAAALVVVMLLFFIISLAAAYTSRNLIFEQRTSANQYRSTKALEAAEAGSEWTLAQLNAGRSTPACQPSANDTTTTDTSFRDRYLTINVSTGALTPRVQSGTGSVQSRCVFDGTDADPANWRWNCSCPLNNAGSPSATISTPAGSSNAPAFIVELLPGPGSRNDLLQMEVNSCTRLGNDCLNYNTTRGSTGDGVAGVRGMIALRGALTRAPSAAVTVAGTFNPPVGPSLLVRNSDTAVDGITVHTAGTFGASSGLTLEGLPGNSPLETAVRDDGSLQPTAVAGFTAADRRFAAIFGMLPSTYKNQPGLPILDCSVGCDAALIQRTLNRNPGRPIWLEGSGTVTIDSAIGLTASTPVLLIVEGDISMSGSATVNGMIYGRKANWLWTLGGTNSVLGAVVAEGNLAFAGSSVNSASVVYDAAILKALRVGYGTFVRVAGSWRDF